MATKVLVVVDVQNDFAKGGSLAYGYPEKSNTDGIIAKVKEFLANGDVVIATRDTHHENYLNTLEGKNLPVPHCIHHTKGWELVGELQALVNEGQIAVVDKPTFGTSLVGQFVRDMIGKYGPIEEVDVCGYVTSICVLANCVMLRSYIPNQKIVLLQNLCGDINEESHKAALTVLRNQQIEIV
ncbi:MAG: cysteine hydrolase [Prevotella sp.]|nr:cysteine hydrolase [Prevotella sp.]